MNPNQESALWTPVVHLCGDALIWEAEGMSAWGPDCALTTNSTSWPVWSHYQSLQCSWQLTASMELVAELTASLGTALRPSGETLLLVTEKGPGVHTVLRTDSLTVVDAVG